MSKPLRMYVSADPELSEIEHLRIRLMVLSLALMRSAHARSS